MVAMMAMSRLTEDRWALMNAIALFVSVTTRHVILRQLRTGIDKQINNLSKGEQAKELCKSMLVTPSGHKVILRAPRAIITEVILTNPKPPSKLTYHVARILGWVGFGVHVVCLGMSSLVNQIVIVFVLVTSTLITGHYIGADHQHIASKLFIERRDLNGKHDSRLEMENLARWGELPQPEIKSGGIDMTEKEMRLKMNNLGKTRIVLHEL